jgi:hypothetical protein
VAVFDATQNGAGAPLRWFGDVTSLGRTLAPLGLALDTGDFPPLRAIAGDLTELVGATGVAVCK